MYVLCLTLLSLYIVFLLPDGFVSLREHYAVYSDRTEGLKPSRNQKQTTVILERAKQRLFKKTGKGPSRYLLTQGKNFFVCLTVALRF